MAKPTISQVSIKMEEFSKLGLGKALVETLKEFKFEMPTPIQEKSIPLIYQGHDVIGQAATGSGKTLAFGSAIIEKVQKGKGIQALILTPTRELAEQVSQSIKRFSKGYNLNITEVYGGVSINPQIRNLERAEIVVGTPGRILDHLNRRTLNLQHLNFLVIDEADRMVDMGFLPDVEKIINNCPKTKQMLLFSATISPDIDYIAKKHMNHPKTVIVESYIDPSKLNQIFFDVPTNEKFSLLVHLLKNEKSKLVMIFCNTRNNVDILSENLKRFKLPALAIHGGLQQAKRSNVMQDFHKKNFSILICTDVAARGLHIGGVSHVYNYDVPPTSTEYIHRIGRTARAGKEGEAISLVSNRDYENFRRVIADPSLKIKQSPLPEFEKIRPKFRQERSGSRGRDNFRRDNNRGRPHERGRPRGNYGDSKPRGRDSRSRTNDRPRRNFSERDSRPRRDSHQRSRHGGGKPRRDSRSRTNDRPKRNFKRR